MRMPQDLIKKRYKEMGFTGIKFCTATNTFYRFKDEVLYRFPIYTGGEKKWAESDYFNYSGNANKWKNVTQEQIETYNLSRRIR